MKSCAQELGIDFHRGISNGKCPTGFGSPQARNEEQVRDRCQEIIARDHAHPEAISTVDESGIAKSGSCTAAVSRQYTGNRGKVENCTVGVHVGYSTPEFRTILDSRLYLPEDGVNDATRRRGSGEPRWSMTTRLRTAVAKDPTVPHRPVLQGDATLGELKKYKSAEAMLRDAIAMNRQTVIAYAQRATPRSSQSKSDLARQTSRSPRRCVGPQSCKLVHSAYC